MVGILADLWFLSAVTTGEIQAGIELTRGRDQDKARELEAWLDRVASSDRVLPMDATALRDWARRKNRQPTMLTEDELITATAVTHGLTVVTRNTTDFRTIGVEVLNPFAPAQ